MEIPKQIKDDIWEYCRSNDITNINEFTLKLVKQGFTVEKFGATPIERIVEKVVEKEVEVIKEVPIDRVVDRIVEKEVLVTDGVAFDKLNGDIKRLTIANQTLLSSKDELEKEVVRLTKELEAEKNKNKKDIYGES